MKETNRGGEDGLKECTRIKLLVLGSSAAVYIYYPEQEIYPAQKGKTPNEWFLEK
jgi:hypothetical protein